MQQAVMVMHALDAKVIEKLNDMQKGWEPTWKVPRRARRSSRSWSCTPQMPSEQACDKQLPSPAVLSTIYTGIARLDYLWSLGTFNSSQWQPPQTSGTKRGSKAACFCRDAMIALTRLQCSAAGS